MKLPVKRDSGEEPGNAPAPGAVFRALAENIGAVGACVRPGNGERPRAGREARPATPEAGVLPKQFVADDIGRFGGGVASCPVRSPSKSSCARPGLRDFS